MSPTRRRHTTAVGALVVAFLLVLTACASDSGTSADSVPVRPFSDIQEGDIAVVPGRPGEVVLEIGTNIDVACSVVYGLDESFGSVATDSDMAGGAHNEHRPILVGLEAGETYFYRLQGVDTEGNLYRSETFTFVAPDEDAGTEVETPGPNLADEATVSGVSSEFSSSFGAANTIDLDGNTEWSSDGDGNDAWIELDLGAPRELTGVGFWTRSMTDGTATTTRFSVTVDGAEIGEFDAEPGLTVAAFETTGQTIRIDIIDSTGGNTGAREIEIYGA